MFCSAESGLRGRLYYPSLIFSPLRVRGLVRRRVKNMWFQLSHIGVPLDRFLRHIPQL
jgi:hypothetical protein